jgi:drug/metabolite transporter (DMT)-like permease
MLARRFATFSPATQGSLLVLFAIFCLSTAPTIIRLGLNTDLDPLLLLTVRVWLATGLMWLVVWRRPSISRIDRQGLIHSTIAGVFNGSSMVTFYTALTYLDVSILTMLISLYPLFALGLLALRGEPFTRQNTIRLVVALAGVYLLIGPGGDVSLVGVGLMMLTTCLFAFNANWIQWHLRDYPPVTVTLYTLSVAAFVITLIFTGLTLIQGQTFPPLSPLGWGVIAYTAVVATIIARFALFSGIQLIGSGQASLLSPVETLLSVTWASLFLGERLSWVQALGGLLIIGSALLAAVWQQKLRRKRRLAAQSTD